MRARQRLSRIVLLLVIAGAIGAAVAYRDQFDIAALAAWIEDAGLLAPVVFMLVYALATVLFLPGSALTLAGGALFGPVFGTLYSLTGATLGAALAFLISRYIASDWVAARAGGRIKQMVNGVEKEGWRFVAFVRLVPLFPFNLLNYALGLTKIRFLHYLLASYLFMLPGALAYTWLGYAGREAVSGSGGMIRNILIALALLASVTLLPRLIGSIRRGPSIDIDELKQRLEDDAVTVLDVRTAEEFTGKLGHIDGAINIAVEDLPQRIDEIRDYTGQPLAIVCRTDMRSAKAALILNREGFQDVNVVIGGMLKWHAAGLPVTR
jgi:uncharacterized membrane protein YdjX (TVP38/TMEM64 family)/rhodanese-related sulfurtransferase